MSEVTCPECGCNIYLEWKKPEDIKKEEEDCCEMPERIDSVQKLDALKQKGVKK